jgi:sugar lactone lactonase YvrE
MARRIGVAIAAGAALVLSLTGVTSAQAGNGVTTVAQGLDSPRGLAFAPDGSLFVAESGRGGTGPCFTGPEGGTVCFGRTGAVTRVKNGWQERVITRLPSIADQGAGTNAIGPSDVAFHGNGKPYITVGLGADPALRNELPKLGKDASGWLLRGDRHGDWWNIADVAGYEARVNPDEGVPDSNPNSVVATGNGQVVADAGGNSLVRVAQNGRITTLATFPARIVGGIPMQSVPTSVVRGPDGAYYVGELTGFPFAPGAARVYRVVPGNAPTIYAEGFTNIIDLGFGKDGKLYVLEIATNGLLSGDPTGALIRVGGDGSQHIVMSDGLTAPGGLAFKGHAAYVSNCGTCAGTGSVLRIPLS